MLGPLQGHWASFQRQDFPLLDNPMNAFGGRGAQSTIYSAGQGEPKHSHGKKRGKVTNVATLAGENVRVFFSLHSYALHGFSVQNLPTTRWQSFSKMLSSAVQQLVSSCHLLDKTANYSLFTITVEKN